MQYPAFFDKVAPISLQDPLSSFLGAFKNGEMQISYLECVKLAGHSCPTVAGAYMMAVKGLQALYPEGDLPQRGGIKIAMRDAESDGVTGVICNVISFIIGANGNSGFKGIGGNFSRNNLVTYNTLMEGEVKLTRLATDTSVTLSYDPSIIPPDPKMKALMMTSLQCKSCAEENDAFAKLWQERVEKILLSTEKWNDMIKIKKG